jgi:rhodanese-related sulfurtransferase
MANTYLTLSKQTVKKIFIYTILLLGIACTGTKDQHQIDAIKLEELLKTEDIQLIDLRTLNELSSTGKIATAIHINFNGADFKSQINQLDKEKPTIIYCASGKRSRKATSIMTEMGFKTIYDYTGGMNDWTAKGKKTVKD